MNPEDLQARLRAMRTEGTLLRRAQEAARRFVAEAPERPVFPPPEALRALDSLDEPLPAAGAEPLQVLDRLDALATATTVNQHSGRYFGFVNGGVLPAALAARTLADAWDQNAALEVMSPLAARLEAVCGRWLVELLGLPAQTAAGFVTGTSMATFCGLAAARHALLERHGWDVNRQGLGGAPALRVVAGRQAHAAVSRALALLGFGLDTVEWVAADATGAMATEALPALDDRTLLIAQAGNVNSGAFDDFRALCARASAAGAWVHVDGAFGLWAAASPGTRHLTGGVDQADSWSLDAHKTLNTPYDCGIVLCRHPEALAASMQTGGAYLQLGGRRDPMLLVPDMSRRARGPELWAALASLGRDGVAALVELLCVRARAIARGLAAAGFDTPVPAVFNQVLVRTGEDGHTRALLGALQEQGRIWCGATEWEGRAAIRVSVCNWATDAADVAACVEAFVAARRALAGW